jgi:hypothetical protein
MDIVRPSEHQFTMGAQFRGPVEAGATLTVAQGDACVFARHGAPLRVLHVGGYQVPAEFAGPDVEAWFISMRPNMGVRFAGVFGSIPTPEGPLTRVLGQYMLRVMEPTAFYSSFAAAGASEVELETVIPVVNTKLMPILSATLMEHAASFNPGVIGEAMDTVTKRLEDELSPGGLRAEVENIQVMM